MKNHIHVGKILLLGYKMFSSSIANDHDDNNKYSSIILEKVRLDSHQLHHKHHFTNKNQNNS